MRSIRITLTFRLVVDQIRTHQLLPLYYDETQFIRKSRVDVPTFYLILFLSNCASVKFIL